MTTPSQSAQARRSPSSQSSSNTSEVTIGQFRRLDHIGKGSFAEVFRGIHIEKNKIVAIKSVNLSKLNRKLRDNLATEIKILKSLRHPHVVSLIDCQETPSRMHIIMEFCELGDLSAFIKKRADLINHPSTKRAMEKYPNPAVGGLNEVMVRHFAKQIASALEFIRFKTYIHRDLKPQNLLLTPSSQHYYQSGTTDRMPLAADGSSLVPAAGVESLPMLKIADFGFARFLPRNSLAETLCGSPLYMAPEILRYEKYDEKADLWSVGTVLFEMMSAKPPFRASNHVELARKIEERRDQIKFTDGLAISREMKTLIRGLLKRKPIERYGYTAFLADPVIRDEIPGLVDEDLPQPLEPEPVVLAEPPQKVSTEVQHPQESPYSQSPKERSPYGVTPPARLSSRTSSAQKLGTSPSSRPSSSRRTSNAPLATIEQRTVVQERRPTPPHSNTAPVRTLRDREPVAPSAGSTRRYSRDEPSSARAVREQLTKLTLKEPPKAPESVVMKQSLNQSALDSGLDEGFVFVEKRRVEIDALADEIAEHPKSVQTAREVVRRRATTQNSPITSARTPPSKAIAIQQKQGALHQRAGSYEGRRAYRPSFETATSAISKAMHMVAQRGLGISPPALPKGVSPPQPYAAYPPYPTSQSSLLLVEPSKMAARDEDTAIIKQVEELAQLSHVVYGFAEVKYKQIVPIAPSDHNIQFSPNGLPKKLGTVDNAGLGNVDLDDDDDDDDDNDNDDDDDLTPDAIVTVAEEALVLFIKSLAILDKGMHIAGTWWGQRCKAFPDVASRGGPITDRASVVVNWMRDRFNVCCAKAEIVVRKLKQAQKQLPKDHRNSPATHSDYSSAMKIKGSADAFYLMTGVTAEKLMYDRALEMSRTAAVNELVGADLPGCELNYATAMHMLEAILEDDEVPSSKNSSATEKESTEINGVAEEDRESIRTVLEFMKERHRTLKSKIQLQKAAKRTSVAGAPAGMSGVRPPSRSSPSSHDATTGGTSRS